MKRLRVAVAIAFAALVVLAVAAGPAAAAKGSNNDTAHACQHGGWTTLVDPATGLAFKNQGDCVNSGAQGNPPASLVVTAEVSADGRSWGVATGSGLLPGSIWTFSATEANIGLDFFEQVPDDGTLSFGPFWPCGAGAHSVSASATTASGQPIVSNTIDTSPCG